MAASELQSEWETLRGRLYTAPGCSQMKWSAERDYNQLPCTNVSTTIQPTTVAVISAQTLIVKCKLFVTYVENMLDNCRLR